jgi:hypothetical protein
MVYKKDLMNDVVCLCPPEYRPGMIDVGLVESFEICFSDDEPVLCGNSQYLMFISIWLRDSTLILGSTRDLISRLAKLTLSRSKLRSHSSRP